MSARTTTRSPGSRSQRLLPILLIAPSLLLLAALLGWPLISGTLQGFQTATGSFTTANWARMLSEPQFWPAVRNTLLLIVAVVPLQFIVAMIMALILRARLSGTSVYLYFWAVPLAVSDLAAGLVWLSIFTDRGYLNSVISDLGLGDGYAWLSYQNPVSMLVALAIAEIWRSTSLVMIILSSGLQMVPREYDEAAQVFGATAWQRLWKVTLPQLLPSLQVALILRTISAIQIFALVQAMAGNNFPILVGEAYKWFVQLQNPQVASAIAIVIMLVSLLAAVAYLRALQQPTGSQELEN